MKYIALFGLLLYATASCDKSEYALTHFTIRNDCPFSIDIYSSAIVNYQDGSKVESFHDVLAPDEDLALRTIQIPRNTAVADIFTKIDIFKGDQKTTHNVLQDDKWKKTRIDDEQMHYELKVSMYFFQ